MPSWGPTKWGGAFCAVNLEPPQAAPKRQPSGSGCRLERRSKGAGEECPPGRSEVKRTLLRRHGRSQAGRGMSRRRRPQTAAQPSGCRLERRSKGAGEECPPGRSEVKRTLLRRHGRSQTGYRPGVQPGRAHTVRPYEEKRILSAPAGDKPPQAAPKRQPQNKTQEAPQKRGASCSIS